MNMMTRLLNTFHLEFLQKNSIYSNMAAIFTNKFINLVQNKKKENTIRNMYIKKIKLIIIKRDIQIKGNYGIEAIINVYAVNLITSQKVQKH